MWFVNMTISIPCIELNPFNQYILNFLCFPRYLCLYFHFCMPFFFFYCVHTHVFVNVNLINLMNICDLSRIIEKRKLFINVNYVGPISTLEAKLLQGRVDGRATPQKKCDNTSRRLCILQRPLHAKQNDYLFFYYFYLFLNDLLFQSILTYGRPDEYTFRCLLNVFIIYIGPLYSHNLSQL